MWPHSGTLADGCWDVGSHYIRPPGGAPVASRGSRRLRRHTPWRDGVKPGDADVVKGGLEGEKGVFCRLRPGNGWIEPRADSGEAQPCSRHLIDACIGKNEIGMEMSNSARAEFQNSDG